MGYSKYHLNRIFQEETGKTIYKYIQGIRLETAAYQLRESERDFTEIAFIAGYESYQAFSRAFKKVHHQTPREYRQRMHGIELQEVNGIAKGRPVEEAMFQLPEFFRNIGKMCKAMGVRSWLKRK